VTDETQIIEETTEEQPAPGVTLFTVWNAFYEAVLLTMVGNTLNKADKQQYRLKAAEVAGLLTQMEVRIRG
jgi:hypothetical protein